jgi:HD-GYP domain-containing protein (c-di-GMP phosphodiesterase class II)
MSDPGPAAGERIDLHLVRDLITPGEPLPFKIMDGQGRLLLAAGPVIASEAQLTPLMQRGASVHANEALHERGVRAAAAGTAPTPAMAGRKLSLFDRWDRQPGELDALLRRVAQGAAHANDLYIFLDRTITLIQRDTDVATFMALRRDHSRFKLYPVVHALDCTTVAVLTARAMGMNEAMTRSLAGAALTMNVAMLDLQATMAEQDDRPTQRQLEQIRAHPEAAVTLLRQAGIADAAWLTAVAQHHERAQGLGYPQGLAQPHPAARLLRAVDVFMAKITPRRTRPALRVQTAARQLFEEEKGGPVANALIKAYGLFPPGELVLLKSGERAVVARRTAGGNTPQVALYADARDRPVVSTRLVDTSEPDRAIQQAIADLDSAPRLMPERVYGWIDA